METTHLSNEGQIVIPQALRDTHQWKAGQELIVIEIGDGILLKPKKPFQETALGQVAGCLKYLGDPKSLDDLETAIAEGVEVQWHDCG
jgi:AbrB family looped-hinge helix DNA binding protein